MARFNLGRLRKTVAERIKSQPDTGVVAPSLAWELWGIFLLALSVLHALALLSHHPQDLTVRLPGPSHVHNWIGPTGAMLAEISLWALGVQAYFIAFTIFIVGFRCFWRGELSICPRVVSGGVLFSVSAALLLADGAIPLQTLSYPPGGAWGQVLSRFSVGLLSTLGTRIVAGTGVLVAFVLLSGWSVSAGLHRALRPLRGFACHTPWFWGSSESTEASGSKPLRGVALRAFAWLKRHGGRDVPVDCGGDGADPQQNLPLQERKVEPRSLLFYLAVPFAWLWSWLPVGRRTESGVNQGGDQNEPGSRAPVHPPAQDMQASKGALRAFAPKGSGDSKHFEGTQSVESKTPQGLEIVKRDAHQGARIVQQAEGRGEGVFKGKETDNKPVDFALPPLNLLHFVDPQDVPLDEASMRDQANKLEKTFLDFSIQGAVRQIRPGPVVTMFEFVPAPGVKLSRISALSDDIAMAMQALHVRIVAPIPGRGAVGIEIPNEQREVVYLKEIVAHPEYQRQKHKLCVAIGKTVAGQPYFANLADMPHLLIAGTTGSGKSVGVNAMICSILYRATPQQVRFLMIDPKMLELGVYEGIPHLLLPPIIDSTKAARALQWAVREMDRRYMLMNELGVRGIEGYNARVRGTVPPSATHFSGDTNAARSGLQGAGTTREGDQSVRGASADFTGAQGVRPTKGGVAPLPYIVVVVDEYADLVVVAGKDVEMCVMRLAQKARACGIHVILATQRPSVDVITGVIKANFPVRIGFRLASVHDSKTIINTLGAEKLLGRGDMLMLPSGSSELTRVHGAFLSDQELQKVVEFWRAQAGPDYDETVAAAVEADEREEADESGGSERKIGGDLRYQEAVAVVMRTGKCSTSWLQRQLGVGYNRAARLVEQLEKQGVVGPIRNAKGDREIFGTTTV